jgi:hypothetical protein
MFRDTLLKDLAAGFIVAAIAAGCGGTPAPKPGAAVTDAAAGDPALVPAAASSAANKGPVGPGAGAGALDNNVVNPNTETPQ